MGNSTVDGITEWFDGLDGVDRLIMQEHVCAADPTPLDVLASELRVLRHALHGRRNDLPQSLENTIEEDGILRVAVADVEREIALPVPEDDLLGRFPWLGTDVSGGDGITALDVLCGLRWPGARSGGWVFDGDVERERQRTLAALSVEPGGTITWPTAERLLLDASVRFPADRRWLSRWFVHSGLLVTGQSIGPRATASAQDGPDPLWEALIRLRTLLVERSVSGTLASHLLDPDSLPDGLRELAHQVAGAHLGADGQWHLGPGTRVTTSAGGQYLLAATSADGSPVPELDVVEEALREADRPLSTWSLHQRCVPDVTASRLRQALAADDRFRLSDRDAWSLSEWGLPEYKPLKELIGDMVDEAGGRVPSYEVVKRLTSNFTVKETSVRAVMSAHPFTSRGGIVRRLPAGTAGMNQSALPLEGDDVPSAVELLKDMGLDF